MQTGKMKQYLNEAEHSFILKSGAAIRNIRQLAKQFELISSSEYEHHSKEHDFSKWITDCIGDAFLAEKLRQAEDAQQATHFTNARILQLEYFTGSIYSDQEAIFNKILTTLTPRPEFPHQPTEPIAPDKQETTSKLSDEMLAIISDIELLASTISTDSFLKTYQQRSYAAAPRIQEEVKETSAALEVLKKKQEHNLHALSYWNYESFFSRLKQLVDTIRTKDTYNSKILYTQLKKEFESTDLPGIHKKNIHSTLSQCYNDIISLSRA